MQSNVFFSFILLGYKVKYCAWNIYFFLGNSLMHCWSFMLHRKYAVGCLYLLLCPLQQTFLLFICPGVNSQITIRSLVPSGSIADPTYWDLWVCYTLCSHVPLDEVWIVFTMSSLCQDRQPSAGTFCLLVEVDMLHGCCNAFPDVFPYTRVGSEQFRVIQLFIFTLAPLSALWVKSRNSSM